MIRTIGDLVAAEEAGQYTSGFWRKVSTSTTLSNTWFDWNTATGMGKPDYYAGSIGKFEPRRQSIEGGIYHGPAQSGFRKYVKTFSLIAGNNTQYYCAHSLIDIIGVYPMFDTSTTDEQICDNTAVLPRFEDGLGVRAYVVAQFGMNGVTPLNIVVKYINDKGNPSSAVVTTNLAVGTGSVLSCNSAQEGVQCGPWIDLQSGDLGIQRITSVQIGDSYVNVGTFAIVLAKTVDQVSGFNYNSVCEKTHQGDGYQSLPQFHADAYLSVLGMWNATTSSFPLNVNLTTIWG